MGGKGDKWADWEMSEQASRSERKLKKARFYYMNYRFESLKDGCVVYEERRGLYSDQLKDLEECYENKANKERKIRRHRKLNESLNWSRYK